MKAPIHLLSFNAEFMEQVDAGADEDPPKRTLRFADSLDKNGKNEVTCSLLGSSSDVDQWQYSDRSSISLLSSSSSDSSMMTDHSFSTSLENLTYQRMSSPLPDNRLLSPEDLKTPSKPSKRGHHRRNKALTEQEWRTIQSKMPGGNGNL